MSTPKTEAVEPRKPSFKERQRQLREDAILDAAEELVLEKGQQAMTLDELSARVGISKPTLYQHFGSKDEVLTGILERAMRRSSDKLTELASSMPPGPALRTFMEWFIQDRARPRFDSASSLCLALVQYARGPILEAEQAFTQELERLVEAAQRDGTVRTDVPPMFVSQTFLSTCKDARFRELLTNGRTDVDTMQRAVIQMLLGS